MTVDEFVAFTVRVDEPPAMMDVGLAVMVTVGFEDVTVTIVVAVALPPFPTAVAV